jgi:hypothetical protein
MDERNFLLYKEGEASPPLMPVMVFVLMWGRVRMTGKNGEGIKERHDAPSAFFRATDASNGFCACVGMPCFPSIL